MLTQRRRENCRLHCLQLGRCFSQKPFFLLPPDIACPSQLLVVSYPPLVSGPAPLVPKRHTDTHIATRGQHGGVGLPSLERVRAPSSRCTSLLISVSRLAGGNSASSIPRGSHAGPPFQTMSPSPHFLAHPPEPFHPFLTPTLQCRTVPNRAPFHPLGYQAARRSATA